MTNSIGHSKEEGGKRKNKKKDIPLLFVITKD